MPKRKEHKATIAVLAGWGEKYGTGHIQRMVALIRHLNTKPDVEALLWSDSPPKLITGWAAIPTGKVLGNRIDLIIRDMRDSSTEEMLSLKARAPVLALDDLGPGRSEADFVLDLLPHTYDLPSGTGTTDDGLFIFGDTFISGLAGLGERVIEKTIDYALYPGVGAPPEYITFLKSLLPRPSTTALLQGSSLLVDGPSGVREFGQSDYSLLLLSSKVLISHFGVSLYEAAAAGCRPVAINPTPYHSVLSDRAPASLGLRNLGVSGTIDREKAVKEIIEAARNPVCDRIIASQVHSLACNNLDRVYVFLKGVIR